MSGTNAFTLVDENIRNAEFDRLRGNRAGAERVVRDTTAALETIQQELGEPNAENGGYDLDNIQSIPGSGGEKMQKITELHSHLAAAVDARDECRSLERMAEWRTNRAEAGFDDETAPAPAAETLSGAVMQAQEAGGRQVFGYTPEEGQARTVQIDISGVLGADFVTSDGIAPDVRRGPRIAADLADYHQPFVMDLYGGAIPTDQAAVKWLKETIASPDNVKEVAEAGKEAELDLSYAEQTSTVRTIRGDIPVSEEQLADVPTSRALIDGRLRRRALLRLDAQLVNGNGTAPNLRGIISTSGIHTQKTIKAANAWTGVDTVNEVRLSMASTRSKGETPATGIAMNPIAWALVQTTLSNGVWIIGSPAVVAANRLWGLPLAEADTLSDLATDGNNYGIVGDFINSADIYLRRNAEVTTGYIGDDFAKYMVRMRVVMRAAHAVYQPGAFGLLQRDYS